MNSKSARDFRLLCIRRIDFGKFFHKLIKERLIEHNFAVTSDDFESTPGIAQSLFKKGVLSTWQFELQVVKGSRIFRVALYSSSKSEKSYIRQIEFRVTEGWISGSDFKSQFGVGSSGYYIGSSGLNRKQESIDDKNISPSKKAVGSDFALLKFLVAIVHEKKKNKLFRKEVAFFYTTV